MWNADFTSLIVKKCKKWWLWAWAFFWIFQSHFWMTKLKFGHFVMQHHLYFKLKKNHLYFKFNFWISISIFFFRKRFLMCHDFPNIIGIFFNFLVYEKLFSGWRQRKISLQKQIIELDKFTITSNILS